MAEVYRGAEADGAGSGFAFGGNELAVAQGEDLLVEPAGAGDAVAGDGIVLLEVAEEGVDFKDALGVDFAQARRSR